MRRAAAATLFLSACAASPSGDGTADASRAEPADGSTTGAAPTALFAPSADPDEPATGADARGPTGLGEPAALQASADPAAPDLALDGEFIQGGLIFAKTVPGATATLDGVAVFVGETGDFVFGFGRDNPTNAELVVAGPDGGVVRRAFDITKRTYKVSRIDGLDQSKVDGFTPAQLEQIRADTAKKKAARKNTEPTALWRSGFDWPVTGRISGVFGSQRVLNGVPKRPHSGIDIARPTGTPVRAPADGVVTLAEEDMYFEGGLILMDHGHWLESAFVHLSRLDVEPGQRVKKGEVLGAVGATGRATGPHLHWSVKWAGRLVDPQLLVGDMPETD
ncbi:MAG: M23 family metallopeptidase [Pseudomonadota bacterium]